MFRIFVIAVLPLFFVFSSEIFTFLSGALCPSCNCESAKPLHRIPRPQLRPEFLALENGTDARLGCEDVGYKMHVFSREPLVVYFENFVSAREREHLLDISEKIYTPSTITHNGGQTSDRNTKVRDSEVALVPRTEGVRCIERRAREVQGWREEVWIERLRVQRYNPGGHYSHHFDWSSGRGGWGRVSSFMVWVHGEELEGGGTEFPRLELRGDRKKWCKFIECEDNLDGEDSKDKGVETAEDEKGAVFKVIPGNAVYWENFRSDGTGRGYNETWHAGLPVKKGVKVGLNIWSYGRID
ncbi:uncharacterized protein QC764_702630 [Podospora pseudoanserina]|uniref:Fe2OG dioxygenase domain-containing protein n=1 Tax=Podospora pseudoanserina TaxID=2609844 RepID=A0ABR0HJH5_9PEZI|nr:hypothetical protein QC764_702630 [Podospora pseudoanserina]